MNEALTIGPGLGSTSVGPRDLHVVTHGGSERRHAGTPLFIHGAGGFGHMFPIESGWDAITAVLQRWQHKTFPASCRGEKRLQPGAEGKPT